MTTMRESKQKCFVCGKEATCPVLSSTNAMGSPDLDLRPPEMERSTMVYWIQKCPHCGYVSGKLSDDTSINQGWLASPEYKTCEGIKFASGLAARFYQYHMVSLADKKLDSAFYALLHSAWACDDADDKENAIKCRKLAIPLLERLIEEGENAVETENLKVLKADLQRRALLFDSLIEEYRGQSFSNDLLNQIILFQLAKARQQDAACYTVSDVAETS